MANYEKVWVKLINTQLNKLKSASKNKAETILRLNKKDFWRWRMAASIISHN